MTVGYILSCISTVVLFRLRGCTCWSMTSFYHKQQSRCLLFSNFVGSPHFQIDSFFLLFNKQEVGRIISRISVKVNNMPAEPCICQDKPKMSSVLPFVLGAQKKRLICFARLAPVLKTIFHQCVISYTCSQSYSDGSVLNRAIRVRLATSI